MPNHDAGLEDAHPEILALMHQHFRLHFAVLVRVVRGVSGANLFTNYAHPGARNVRCTDVVKVALHPTRPGKGERVSGSLDVRTVDLSSVPVLIMQGSSDVPELIGTGEAAGVGPAVLTMDVALHGMTALGDSAVESVAVNGCTSRMVQGRLQVQFRYSSAGRTSA
jgi:hypothetical protein